MTKQEIMNVLKGDYNSLLKEGYDLFGVFLFGSQNYGLDCENSDIDVKAIYLSKDKEEVVMNSGNVLISTGIFSRSQTEGQINMMSPEVFINNLSLNYHTWFELLYTGYYIINPKHSLVWNEILTLREKLAKQDKYSFIDSQLNCIVDQIPQAITGDDLVLINKRLSTFYRLKFLIEKYVLDFPYELCLIPTEEEKEFLLNIKQQARYTDKECQEQTNHIVQDIKETIFQYKETHEDIKDYSALEKVRQLLLAVEEEGDESAI
jgi:hypothetical protein